MFWLSVCFRAHRLFGGFAMLKAPERCHRCYDGLESALAATLTLQLVYIVLVCQRERERERKCVCVWMQTHICIIVCVSDPLPCHIGLPAVRVRMCVQNIACVCVCACKFWWKQSREEMNDSDTTSHLFCECKSSMIHRGVKICFLHYNNWSFWKMVYCFQNHDL